MLSLTSPARTVYHRLPAGTKLALLSVATAGLFLTADPWLLAGALAAVILLYAAAGSRFFAQGLDVLRPLRVFVAIVLAWHVWAGDPAGGLVICLRMTTTVALANLVTMTTGLDDMIDVVGTLARPLRSIGLAAETLALAIALVIRFTPVLAEKGGNLYEAWRARSPRRPGWNIVLPLTLVALDDADHVAEALRARGGLQPDVKEP